MRSPVLLLLFSTILFCGQSNAQQSVIYVTSIKSVYDGDTFRAYLPSYKDDQRIRLRGVDTPEIKGLCESEVKAAVEARDFVKESFKNSTSVKLVNIGRDKYNRVLADVFIDDLNLAQTLINKGLGREWRGQRESWCD